MTRDLLLCCLLAGGCVDPGTAKPDPEDSRPTPVGTDSQSTTSDSVTRPTDTAETTGEPPCPDKKGLYSVFKDRDGDGFGDLYQHEAACEGDPPPPGWVTDSTDCDDTRADVHPGAVDGTDNDVDEDCDGMANCGLGRIYKGDLTFTGDSAPDDMAAFCASYEMLDGDVYVADTNTLTDFSPLSCLCEVCWSCGYFSGGYFRISNAPNLASFHGLESLKRVGYIAFSGTSIRDLAGLERLEYAGGLSTGTETTSFRGVDSLRWVPSITLRGDTVRSLEGLEAVDTVRSLYIDLPAVESFVGLDNLEALDGGLSIDFHGREVSPGFARLVSLGEMNGAGRLEVTNAVSLRGLETIERLDYAHLGGDSLLNLDGLGSLETVDDLSASGPNLQNIDGLSGLTMVGQEVSVTQTEVLADLDGFWSLREAGGIYITDNASLVSVAGLRNVESVDTLVIQNNPNLPDAEVEALIRAIGEANIGTLDVRDNGG